MPPLLQLQKIPGKGDGGWNKSVFASFFCWPEDREFVEIFIFIFFILFFYRLGSL